MSATNESVCHAFVHQHKNKRTGRVEGKNGKGSIFYEYNTLYSYGTHYVLAKLYMLPRPIGAYDRIIVRSTRSVSISTTGHQRHLYSAIDRESMLEVVVDDAGTYKINVEDPKEVINIIHTMALDEERGVLSAAAHGNLYRPEDIHDVRGKVRLLTLAFNSCKRKITKEARALIDRVLAEDYVAGLLEASTKAQEEHAKLLREKRVAQHRKRITDIVETLRNPAEVGMAVSTATRDVMEALESDELPADDRTTLTEALTVCVARIIALLPEMTQLLHTPLSVYEKQRAPLAAIELGHIYNAATHLNIDTAPITAYYEKLLESSRAAYEALIEHGQEAHDARYTDLLRTHFGMHGMVSIRCAFGGTVPGIGDTTYNHDARELPSAVIWKVTGKDRIRTSMSSEITLAEFKRYCSIITALNDGTMTVDDIPESLRKLMGGYRIHSYDRETGIIVVGCHRLLMRNVIALARRVCA